MERVWFSRRFLQKILRTKGILKCHYCTNKNLIIQWNSNYKIPKCKLATIDHINPVSNGGDIYNESNLVVCCSECNSKKGNIPYLEFIKNKDGGDR